MSVSPPAMAMSPPVRVMSPLALPNLQITYVDYCRPDIHSASSQAIRVGAEIHDVRRRSGHRANRDSHLCYRWTIRSCHRVWG